MTVPVRSSLFLFSHAVLFFFQASFFISLSLCILLFGCSLVSILLSGSQFYFVFRLHTTAVQIAESNRRWV
jgi:uncharacterized protein YceK